MPSKKKAPAKKSTKAPAKPAAKAKAPVVARGTATAKGVKAAVAKASKKAKAAKPSPAAKPKAKSAQVKGPERDAANREIVPAETPRFNVRGLVTEMIAEQKHTDQEILAAVAKAIPEKTINLNIIGACRSEMNHGTRLPANVDRAEKHTPPAVPYEQVLKIDGVNMRRSERPPKPGKPRKPARGKVKAENDPLAKLGIPAVKRAPARRAAVPA